MAKKKLPEPTGRIICPRCGSRNTDELDARTNECYDCGRDYKKPWRKIEPYTARWEKQATAMAREFSAISPCKVCGHPVLTGYCCETCGCIDP